MRKFLIVFFLVMSSAFSYASEGERIVYQIRPFGKAEYKDMGFTDLEGGKLQFMIFTADMPGFHDTEKIYVDPETHLPFKVERYIKWVVSKEHLVETYSGNSLSIKKYLDQKLVHEYSFKSEEGPIHNAVYIPFALREIRDIPIGWTYDVRLPQKFTMRMVEKKEIETKIGKKQAFHFVSDPHKFDIWISDDEKRIPLVIKCVDGFKYSMFIQKYFEK